MAEEPEQLKHDIEGTRSQLSADLDALSDKISPSNVAHRQVEAAKASVAGVRDRIMGSAHDAADSVKGAADSVKGAASSSGDAAGGGVAKAKSKAQGNPLAAGVIAFGAGWLLSSLFPASAKETEATRALVETAKDKGQPLLQEAKSMASEVGSSLGEHAKEAAAQVKETAQDAAGTVQEDARSAAGTVQEQGRESAGNVKGSAQDARS
ncbi:DUF3618 domain-containing protein [Kineococcus sp. SYSU DK003]|uniref:DUF3618 domain-containing protein n=1 Tax=Kineococcus sp. SYSU DK003 TaxID=3383124 RepID=UPI003D7D0A39